MVIPWITTDNLAVAGAAAVLDQLGHRYGAEPTLLFNRAILAGWLADDSALVAIHNIIPNFQP